MKNSHSLLFLLLLAFNVKTAFAQNDSTLLQLYPLQIGNYWEYEDKLEDLMRKTTTYTYYSVEVVGDTVMPNQKSYQILVQVSIPDTLPHQFYYERIDSNSCNIYRYDATDKDELFIDSLRLIKTEGYFIGASRYFSIPFTPISYVDSTEERLFDSLKQLYHYYANDMITPFGYEYWFAGGLGLVRGYLKDTTYRNPITLIHAVINGKSYGSSIKAKSSNFFPLAVGNRWSYYSTETGVPNGPIAFNSVTDSIIIQGKTYFNYIDGGYPIPYRSDSVGHVYRYINDKEILLYDFTKAEGDSYYVDLGGNHFKVTMTNRNATVINRAGKFANCLSLLFDDPNTFDEQFEYFFAENIGIVKQTLGLGISMELYDANVNGKQYPDLTDYFPLSIGNTWTYREVGIEGPGLPIKIIDTLRVNGDLYYFHGSSKGNADLICADSLGRIWQYKNSKKILWFDFTLAEADSYFYKPDAAYLNYIVKAYRNLSVETKFGILNNCILFIFDDPNAVDEEYSYMFAPNLGIIETFTGMGIHYLLDSAIINGKIITKIFSNNITAPHKVKLKQNYPNPFNPSTTITYEIAAAGEVEFNLYNILGQRISTFKIFQPIGVHKIELSAHDLSSGVYIYEIKSGNFAERKKLVVQK